MLAGLFSFITKLFNRDWALKTSIFKSTAAFRLAAATMLAGFFAGTYTLIQASGAALFMVMPDILLVPVSWVLPNNWGECLSAYVVSHSAIFLYRWQKAFISAST